MAACCTGEGIRVMKVGRASDRRTAGGTGTQPGLGRNQGLTYSNFRHHTRVSSKSFKDNDLITPSSDEAIQRKIQAEVATPKE